MSSEIENLLLTLVIGEFITGMLGNGFIGLVNCIDWVNNHKISSVDFILTSLAISRIAYLWIVLFDLFVIVLRPHIYAIAEITTFINFFWTVTNHLATWFATCLSIFYFFKIAHFSHPCFAWLKRRLSRVLLVLLLGSLFLMFFSFLSINTFNTLWIEAYGRHEKNFTWSSDVSKTLYFNSLNINLFSLIPFLLSLTSLLLLFLSLVRHIRNLKFNSMDTRDFSTVAHIRAMKMVMYFLLLFIVHSISSLSSGWIFFSLKQQEATLFVIFLLTIFPSGHSFILILGNSKLRQTALQLLRHFKCHLKRVKSLTS
ncbi:PREDICTED: taste receptor type 2 member 42-like [Chrysochloris asiatica]|uniref:Taste receptor type 2 n=1 Tax=Chrysochloris asiatica TaxID=185453 RepID=A0A9B0TQZ7_CHRAS|nr:PREDICTED: taste receptor type 2 member 42-like [Chrysochloris asiatica]